MTMESGAENQQSGDAAVTEAETQQMTVQAQPQIATLAQVYKIIWYSSFTYWVTFLRGIMSARGPELRSGWYDSETAAVYSSINVCLQIFVALEIFNFTSPSTVNFEELYVCELCNFNRIFNINWIIYIILYHNRNTERLGCFQIM